MRDILLKNVDMIDGQSDCVLRGRQVLVREGRFLRISSEPIDGGDAAVLDLTGCTILPGLIDCHAHLAWDARDPSANVMQQSENDSATRAGVKCAANLHEYLSVGVTTVRDLGADWHALEAREAVRDGAVPGPRVVAAGPMMTVTGGLCWQCGLEADGEESIRRTVRRLVKAGADLIKVMGTGSSHLGSGIPVDQPAFTDEEMRTLIETSHRLGRRVTVHATTAYGAHQAVSCGADCIEHHSDFFDETLEMMAERGVFLVPTLSGAYLQARDGADLGMSPAAVESRAATVHNDDYARGAQRAVAAGVQLAVGTDQGSPCVPPSALLTEMQLHVQYGLADDVMTAIKRATSVAAAVLGMEDELGSIGPGKLADFVVVDGDPLSDLQLLERPHLVYREGKCAFEDGVAVKCGAI